MKFISEQFARRKFLPSQIGEAEWFNALKEDILDAFNHWLGVKVNVQVQIVSMDITTLYWRLQQMDLPEAMWLRGTTKTAIEAGVGGLNRAMETNGGSLPKPYAYYALHELVDEGKIDHVRDTTYKLVREGTME